MAENPAAGGGGSGNDTNGVEERRFCPEPGDIFPLRPKGWPGKRPKSFYSSISAPELVEEGVEDCRWLDPGSVLRSEPCGTPLGTGSGRVSVSGADFFRGRSLGTDRDSGASVHMGVVGALAGPVRAQEDRDVSLMEIEGGNIPIFWLVASWMSRSNSLTSSMVMSGLGKHSKFVFNTHMVIRTDLFVSV